MPEGMLRFSVAEYLRLSEADPDRFRRTELLDGVIFERVGQNEPHILCVMQTTRILGEAFRDVALTVGGIAITLGETSRPEPDLVVLDLPLFGTPTVAGTRLIVEVSDSRYVRDRRIKAPLYAEAGLKELWIMDVGRRQIEVHRDPSDGEYRTINILTSDDELLGHPVAEFFGPN